MAYLGRHEPKYVTRDGTGSADHDFHMSVVVRGLVERFLDGWQEPPAEA